MINAEQEADQLFNAINQRQSSAPKVNSPIEQEADQLFNSIQQKSQNPNEYSYPERAMQYGRGLASGAGSLVDLAGQAGIGIAEHPMTESLAQAIGNVAPFGAKTPEERQSAINEAKNSNMQEAFARPIEEFAGRSLKPTNEDIKGRIIHGAGEISVPIPGFGPLGAPVKMGAKAVGKALLKEAPAAFGASTALEALPKFTEEGKAPRVGEDLAKVMIGSAAGSKLASTANYLKNMSSQGNVKDALKNASKMPLDFMAKGFSKVGTPNIRTMELAEKHGVELPYNVAVKSSVRNFMANTGFKSMFVSNAYKKSLQDADKSMIDAVNKSIDSLGRADVLPHEASLNFKNFLKEDEKVFQKQAGQLYDLADKSLKPTDMVQPKHTIAAIHSMEDILSRDVSSPATKRIVGLLSELSSNWGLKKGPQKIMMTGVDLSESKLVKELMGGFKQKIEISPKNLYEIKQEIGEILGHEADIRGKEALLYKLSNALEKDMASSPNKEYGERLWQARKFFKENIANRFRTDMARSVMTGEVPQDAFNLMSNPQNIQMLQRISGESQKGKEIFDSLKKAKVRQMLTQAVEGDLQTGKLKSGPFSKIFSKQEKNQEMLQGLLGKKEYNNLSEIADIAQEFSSSGKELLNTSGTALTQADLNRVQKATLGTFGLVFGAYKVADVAGGAAAIAAPYYLSKLMANKEFVRLSNHYAKARAQGKEKYAHSILNRLIPLTEREIKYMGMHEIGEEE